jgi:hypothetical protein
MPYFPVRIAMDEPATVSGMESMEFDENSQLPAPQDNAILTLPFHSARNRVEQRDDTGVMEIDETATTTPIREELPSSNNNPELSPLRVKTRRRRFLELNPDYFSHELEHAEPLLYDHLVRQFQTPTERVIENLEKSYSGVLAADLLRAEAKAEQLLNPNPNYTFSYYRDDESGEILVKDKGEPMDREVSLELWRFEMTGRFVTGKDDDFDYKTVDLNEKYDDPEEERERQDSWFDDMEPSWASDGEGDEERVLTGETGILDY